jgi:hypothetical protein
MFDNFTFKDNPVTFVLILLVVVAAIGGVVVVILHPETLTFEQLLNDLEKFAIALGLLGIGRGVNSGLKAHGQAQSPSFVGDINDTHGSHDLPPTQSNIGRVGPGEEFPTS